MILVIECILLCVLFTLMIIPAQFRDPLSQIMSYPPEIRKRVESLPIYAGMIHKKEKQQIVKKIAAFFVFAILLTILAYYSGARTFEKVFMHVFILFFAVNLYDLIILDLGIFCHSKKVIIPGTEDMIREYQKPGHHIKGALIGTVFGIAQGLLCGGMLVFYNLIKG